MKNKKYWKHLKINLYNLRIFYLINFMNSSKTEGKNMKMVIDYLEKT